VIYLSDAGRAAFPVHARPSCVRLFCRSDDALIRVDCEGTEGLRSGEKCFPMREEVGFERPSYPPFIDVESEPKIARDYSSVRS